MRVFVGLAIVALVLLTGGAVGAKGVRAIVGRRGQRGLLPEDIITTLDGQDVERWQALLCQRSVPKWSEPRCGFGLCGRV
jgi:hypothetical protein